MAEIVGSTVFEAAKEVARVAAEAARVVLLPLLGLGVVAIIVLSALRILPTYGGAGEAAAPLRGGPAPTEIEELPPPASPDPGIRLRPPPSDVEGTSDELLRALRRAGDDRPRFVRAYCDELRRVATRGVRVSSDFESDYANVLLGTQPGAVLHDAIRRAETEPAYGFGVHELLCS
ncbi:MAG: hypothetical protein M3321_09020 [Actinomycetota bacterium]|nr:hypothetical protein [Actinomycetota bacterium]